ncbi:MAG: hypothetical protein QNI90_02780 [Dinoroseobacter sp.]|nr:hypothetical protein [Dinoroseobacter sp.]
MRNEIAFSLQSPLKHTVFVVFVSIGVSVSFAVLGQLIGMDWESVLFGVGQEDSAWNGLINLSGIFCMVAAGALSIRALLSGRRPLGLFATIALLCTLFSLDDFFNLHQDAVPRYTAVYVMLWGAVYVQAIPYTGNRFVWPMLVFGIVMAASLSVDQVGYSLPMSKFHGLWSISVLLEDSFKLSGSVVLFLALLGEMNERKSPP